MKILKLIINVKFRKFVYDTKTKMTTKWSKWLKITARTDRTFESTDETEPPVKLGPIWPCTDSDLLIFLYLGFTQDDSLKWMTNHIAKFFHHSTVTNIFSIRTNFSQSNSLSSLTHINAWGQSIQTQKP